MFRTALLLAAIAAFTSCAAPNAAQSTSSNAKRCNRWDVGGTWSIDQSNGFLITFVLNQARLRVTGTADNGSGPVPVLGTMRDEKLDMTVAWAWGGHGRYTANMTPSGSLNDGFTENLSMPGSTAVWNTTSQFTCACKSKWFCNRP
jgi:hypothetical protein